MTIFEATDGTSYPVSQIASISGIMEVEFSSGRKGNIRIVGLLSGDTVEVTETRVQEIFTTPVHILAAQQGTFILSFDQDEPDKPNKWPVLGWAITTDNNVFPITMNGVNEGIEQSCHVLLPSGHVTAYDRTWDNIAQWKEDRMPSVS